MPKTETITECKHSWETSNNSNLFQDKEVRYCHECKAVQIRYNSLTGFVDVAPDEYKWILDWILWEVGR